jgi:hypothetical protein
MRVALYLEIKISAIVAGRTLAFSAAAQPSPYWIYRIAIDRVSERGNHKSTSVKSVRKGEVLLDDERLGSNCITWGLSMNGTMRMS